MRPLVPTAVCPDKTLILPAESNPVRAAGSAPRLAGQVPLHPMASQPVAGLQTWTTGNQMFPAVLAAFPGDRTSRSCQVKGQRHVELERVLSHCRHTPAGLSMHPMPPLPPHPCANLTQPWLSSHLWGRLGVFSHVHPVFSGTSFLSDTICVPTFTAS